jgi:hypothetical protein
LAIAQAPSSTPSTSWPTRNGGRPSAWSATGVVAEIIVGESTADMHFG